MRLQHKACRNIPTGQHQAIDAPALHQREGVRLRGLLGPQYAQEQVVGTPRALALDPGTIRE